MIENAAHVLSDTADHEVGAVNRVELEVEGLRETLLSQISSVIGRNLTVEEIRLLANNPEALGFIKFEVDKALRKVAGWVKKS